MIKTICKTCKNSFLARDSHVSRGWGIFCSAKCKHIGMRNRTTKYCYICDEILYRTNTQVKNSKSGKFFCSKSCQTKWRNSVYSGSKHLGWKDGFSTYRKDLLRSGVLQICALCKEKDLRVLAVHHLDENHSNNSLENLLWLCHNCHYLVHHDKLEKLRFEDTINLK